MIQEGIQVYDVQIKIRNIRAHLQIYEQPIPGLNKNIFNVPLIKHTPLTCNNCRVNNNTSVNCDSNKQQQQQYYY